MRRSSAIATRLLGVGLAAVLAVVTLVLAVTDQLALYINPESAWFAVGMAVFALVGTVVSFTLPLGAEADHGHDHGDSRAASVPDVGHDHGHVDHGSDHAHDHHDHASRPRRQLLPVVAATTGGLLATGVAVAILVVPPATLSAELAMSRDTGAAPLFQGSDTIALASTGDTASFGVGQWASVFATATNPDAFDGDEVTLTGFVTPGGGADFALTRLVITHCVIDAQSATLPVGTGSGDSGLATGDWVTVTGVIRDVDGRLEVQASSIEPVDQPKDPYEY